MPALANANAATRVATLCKRNVFIVDCLSIHVLGTVHSSARPAGTLGQVSAAADLFSCRDKSLDLAADRWNRLGRETKRRTREIGVLGRPGILLFLCVDLLGFLLPFQLLANEVELLIFLRPELLS
jgi:hypothetical protein